MTDSLGDRIKSNYEDRARYMLPRRTYTIIRIDGKAFHTYTKGLKKPFDMDLIEDLDSAVKAILPEIQGAQFAYVQSDEISILLTDFATPETCAWFDGNVQKMASVSASLMTAEFNFRRMMRTAQEHSSKYEIVESGCLDGMIKSAIYDYFHNVAHFDSRVFTIPDWIEVYNYFVWRNQDAVRNSIQMLARSLYSHSDCQYKSCLQLKAMIMDKGADPEKQSEKGELYGRLIVKEDYVDEELMRPRTRWAVKPASIFTREPDALKALIPKKA